MNSDYLKECFTYEAETGKLFWKERPWTHFTSEDAEHQWNGRYAGKPAGCLNKDGYVKVGLDYKRPLAHRIIWCMVHGDLPKYLDHINGNRSDNRLENLRPATCQQNQYNRRVNRNSTTGLKGVYRHQRGFYVSNIRKEGKQVHLGCFETPELAHAAYCKAANELHGEYARAA